MRAVSAATDEAFELAPGVVIDPSRPAVYLARPEGGIAALDPASGRPRWISDEAARPLLAGQTWLLAQRDTGGGLSLAVLDPADGSLRLRLEVPLPEGVRAAVDESLESRFTTSVRAAGDDAILEWEYLERDVLGVSPPGGRPFAHRELGSARVDLSTGTVTPVDADFLPLDDREPLPAPVERLVASGQLAAPLWRTAEVLAAAEQRLDNGAERLILRRWRADSGESLPEVPLHAGRPRAVLAAADRRHLLVVSLPDASPGQWEPYLWRIHSLATGEVAGSRHAARSASPFCVLQGRLVYLDPPYGRRVEGRWEEAPLRLRVIDLESGAYLWQRPVRDPAFRGPTPPRP